MFRLRTESELGFVEHFKSGEFVTDSGATILSEGRSSSHLYTLLQGWAFRYKLLPDGRRQILSFALPGDFLGLRSSATPEMQYSIEALTPTVLCVFSRDRLWSLYEKHPALAYDLTWIAARGEAIVDDNLLSVGRRSAIERVAYTLLDLFVRARQINLSDGAKLDFPLTQQHLADASGLSLVHTNKTLRQLLARRLVRWKSGTLEILDEERLAQLCFYTSEPADDRPLI